MAGSTSATWTSVVAIGISGIALFRTWLAEQRARANEVRTSKSTRFETDFGHPIRDQLRSFQHELSSLRVFSLAVATPVEDRLKELADYRSTWDQAAAAVEMLLREADESPGVDGDYWADTWQANVLEVDRALQALDDLEAPTDADLRQRATEAYQAYLKAIADARSGIEAERSKLAPLPPSSILPWLSEKLFRDKF